MEASHKTHRPHIKVGKDAEEEEETNDGPRASPLGDHMTRKDDKGHQPSGGETTWTNTGATRYGRG